MVLLGMVNGFFRGLVLIRYFDETTARQVSTGILILLLIAYMNLIFDRLAIRSAKQAWAAGLVWALLTFLFETLLGYFVSGLTMTQILIEYDIFQGRLWSLVLLILVILPPIFHRLKGLSSDYNS